MNRPDFPDFALIYLRRPAPLPRVQGNEKLNEAYCNSLVEKAKNLSKPNQPITFVSGSINNNDGSDLKFKVEEPRTNLQLSFVSFSTYATTFKFAPDDIAQVRKHSGMVSEAIERGWLKGLN